MPEFRRWWPSVWCQQGATCLVSAGCNDEKSILWERDGRPEDTDVIESYRGSDAHCLHEDVIFLTVDWPVGTNSGRPRQYIRDPEGDLDDVTVTSFQPDAALLDEARSSGYSSSVGELWFAAADEGSVAYIVSDGGNQVEAWPRTKYAIGCD